MARYTGLDMDRLLLTLLVALAINECIHNGFELWGMRQKVQWLRAQINNKPHGKWPIDIDTDFKTFALHGGMFMVFVSVALGILVWLNLAIVTLLQLGIVLMVFNYAYTTIRVHEYHLDIGKLLKRFKLN